MNPKNTTEAAQARHERALARQDERKDSFRGDERAEVNVMNVAIGIGISLTVLTSVIVPQVTTAKADPDLGTGEKALIGLITLIVAAAIAKWSWHAMTDPKRARF